MLKYSILISSCLIAGFLFLEKYASAQDRVYWSTYVKGKNPDFVFDSQDMAEDVAVDTNGDVYVVGRTNSVKAQNAAVFKHANNSSGVSFIAKYNKCGSLQWVSYLGNDNLQDCPSSVSCSATGIPLNPHGCSEWAYCVAIDHVGAKTYLYVGGEVMMGGSGNPILVAGQSPFTAATATAKDRWDAYIAKYDASNGTRVNWTYLSGTNSLGCSNTDGQAIDQILAIAVDANHDVYATGYTESDNLGDTDKGYVNSKYQSYTAGIGGDCFIARFDKNLTSLKNIEYYGEKGNDRSHSIVISDEPTYGRCLVIGGTTQSFDGMYLNNTAFPIASNPYDSIIGANQDAFVLKWKISDFISNNPLGPYWVTYVGGTGTADKGVERGRGLGVDASGTIYFTGWTNSSADLGIDPSTSLYPNLMGENDGYLAKIGIDGSLKWMTYFGGSGEDNPNSLRVFTVNNVNYIVISGATQSNDFAQIGCSDLRCTPIDGIDAFITEFKDCDPLPGYCDGKKQSVVLQTYLGGSKDEFDKPTPPNVFNSYGPSMDIRPLDHTIYFAFSTKSDSASIASSITPDHWGSKNDHLQDNKGDAFVGKIVPHTFNDACSFPGRLDSENDFMADKMISIEPNPFENLIQLTIDAPSEKSGVIVIYNMLGQIVFQKESAITDETNEFNLDLSSFIEGVYLCRVYFPDGSLTAKLIKQ